MRSTSITSPLTAALAAVLSTVPAVAQLTVTAVTPANNARSVSPAASVSVTFASPVDPTTITPQTFRLLGRWSGPVPGQLAVDTAGTTVTFTPSRPLFACEIATLWLSHGVHAATGAPLAGGFTAMWFVAAAPSSGNFVLDQVVDYRLPGEGLIRTYGFFAGDVDRDGSPDMSSTNEVAFDIRLLKNDGCGHYGPLVRTQMPNGEEPSPNEGGDFNGDGWLDLATGNQNGNSVAVFLNDGASNYLPPIVTPIGGSVHGLAVADIDADGWLDVLATNQQDLVLVRNLGNGTFAAPVFVASGGNGPWSLGVADANGDGRIDAFVGNAWTSNVTLLLGNGAGGFTPSQTIGCGGWPWQMAVGDVDGDGKVDCVLAEATNGRAAIVRGNGLGGMLPASYYPVGQNPVSVDIGDLEGDGDLDVVIGSFSNANATLWRNNGNGTFANPSTVTSTSAGSCAVIVDFDRDGDTDVILVDELDDKAFVWRQTGPAPAGVQPPSCDAALRVDSFANRGGFAGAPAHAAPAGGQVFLGVSGGASQFYALFVGVPLANGVPSPFGLLNLDPGQPFASVLGGLLDGFGETLVPVAVPLGLPPGGTLTMQCLVTAPAGLVTTNPEQLVF